MSVPCGTVHNTFLEESRGEEGSVLVVGGVDSVDKAVTAEPGRHAAVWISGGRIGRVGERRCAVGTPFAGYPRGVHTLHAVIPGSCTGPAARSAGRPAPRAEGTSALNPAEPDANTGRRQGKRLGASGRVRRVTAPETLPGWLRLIRLAAGADGRGAIAERTRRGQPAARCLMRAVSSCTWSYTLRRSAISLRILRSAYMTVV